MPSNSIFHCADFSRKSLTKSEGKGQAAKGISKQKNQNHAFLEFNKVENRQKKVTGIKTFDQNID